MKVGIQKSLVEGGIIFSKDEGGNGIGLGNTSTMMWILSCEKKGMKAVLDKENLRLQCRFGNFSANSRGEPKQSLPTRGAQGWVEGVTSSTSARFSHW